MNLPNKLTLTRMILVLPFICLMTHTTYLVYSEGASISYSSWNLATTLFLVASIVFIVAMFTDFLDGYLARKWNQISTFGKLFDPLADKLMTTTALLYLAVLKLSPIYIPLLFILRDIVVDGGRNLAASKNQKVAASWLGKIKTILQSVGIPLLFFFSPMISSDKYFNDFLITTSWEMWCLNIVMFISVAFSLASGYDYMHKIIPLIKQN